MVDKYILKLYVDDVDIYEYYFGHFELEQKYNSPLRHDPLPSFHIRCNGKGNLTWKDFGLPDQCGNDAISFICHLFDLDRDRAILKIWNDLVLNKKSSFKQRKPLEPSPKKIHTYSARTMTDFEMKFWEDHCVDRKLLTLYNVWGLDNWKIDGNVVCQSADNNPAYIYIFTEDSFKIYRPLDPDPKKKFRGINNWDVIEGWDRLPQYGQHLFIQSSLKDTAVFRSCGYLGCNPSTENNIDIIVSKKDEINERFENVFILFDPDATGRRKSAMLQRATGWKSVFMPPEWGFKDPADSVKFCRNHLPVNEFIRRLDVPISKYRYS